MAYARTYSIKSNMKKAWKLSHSSLQWEKAALNENQWLFLNPSENCNRRANPPEICRGRLTESHSRYLFTWNRSCRSHKLVGILKWSLWWIVDWVWRGMRLRSFWGTTASRGPPTLSWALPPGILQGSQSEKARKIPYFLWQGYLRINHCEIHESICHKSDLL